MKQNRFLLLLVMIFTMSFAYGQETDAKQEKAVALCKEGVALHDQGKYEEAIKTYDEALAIAPNFIDAIVEKAFTLSAMGKKNEAKKMMEKQIQKADAKDLATLYSTYAGILDDDGEHLKALEIYDKAMKAVDDEDFYRMHHIYYNAAVTMSRLTDKDKQEMPDWDKHLQLCLCNSLQIRPLHADTYRVLALFNTEEKWYCDAFMSYAMFAMLDGSRVDAIENVFAEWAELKLDSASKSLTTIAFNKVNEMMKSEPSEYGRLYDMFSTITPLLCPDTLGTPLPIAYTYDFYNLSIRPFFADLNRQGLLECFFHVAMKNSKKKYNTNADWVAKHKDLEERMWKYIQDKVVFMEDIQYGFVPDTMIINTAEDARKNNAYVMGCCKYYLTHLLETPHMDRAAKNIIAWATASPDVTVNVCSFITNLTSKSQDYLVPYIAGCSFAALSLGEKKFTQDICREGLLGVLFRYANEKERLGKIDELEKLQNLVENDQEGFEKFVEENYNK